MLRLILLLLGIFSFSFSFTQNQISQYIEKYKEIAVAEMHRTGIPASIKLGQAILESSAGTSELATNSHNHFGIKCGGNWDGQGYYKKDDDRDRWGRLIKSCFRVFDTPETSFVAHSEFLLDPNKAYRYGFLFTLDQYDYKSWAWGLKEAGYATNVRYANLLIRIIEEHSLYTYDYYEPSEALAQVTHPERKDEVVFHHPPVETRKIQTKWKSRPDDIRVIDGIVSNNGLSMVYARKGDTPVKLARRYEVDVVDILDYNERLEKHTQPLSTAERVYLEKKKKAYKGDAKFHIVEVGESMYDIAQAYGIRLDRLYIRNRMYPGTQPAYGERIALKGMVKSKDRPRVRTHVTKAGYATAMTDDLADNQPTGQFASNRKDSHVVRSGETLYSIATCYRVKVEELKTWNSIGDDLIRPGQVLYLAP
ncbi:MAG: glucosaminidase domain-containing protein [Saprospiraceae bacterium]|nr:glucosaminidase domain-containing protein [Saprospiraceae bacterium]